MTQILITSSTDFLYRDWRKYFRKLGNSKKTFEDCKRLFLAKASSFEVEGEMEYASGLYRAAEFFMSPGDPDKIIAYEKFISLFYQGKEGENLEKIAVPYGTGRLHGMARITIRLLEQFF